jgi:hypothetical protein
MFHCWQSSSCGLELDSSRPRCWCCPFDCFEVLRRWWRSSVASAGDEGGDLDGRSVVHILGTRKVSLWCGIFRAFSDAPVCGKLWSRSCKDEGVVCLSLELQSQQLEAESKQHWPSMRLLWRRFDLPLPFRVSPISYVSNR